MIVRVVAAGAALIVAAAAFVGLGRWERSHWIASERSHIHTILDEAGGTYRTSTVSAYRIGPPDCLFYAYRSLTYGLELCWDRQGRLIEGADRTGAIPRYWTLRQQPSAAQAFEPAALHAFFAELVLRVRAVNEAHNVPDGVAPGT